MKATLEIEDSKYIRHLLEISWEEWNEMLFNVGVAFLEKWYPDEWLKIAEKSNFWDLWTMHFVRDDIILKDRFLHAVQNQGHYENFKNAMLFDRALFDCINQHLIYKK